MKRIEIINNQICCKECKILQPLDNFNKNSAYKHGREHRCRKCQCKVKFNREYKGRKGTYKLKAIEYPDGTKLCSTCNIKKNKNEFSYTSRRKLKAWCKKCGNKQHQRYIFNLSKEEYLELYNKQNGVCKICKNRDNDRELAVDHCHTTNKIRGFLCGKCNKALGLVNDNTELLKEMIKYLEENEASLIKVVNDLELFSKN